MSISTTGFFLERKCILEIPWTLKQSCWTLPAPGGLTCNAADLRQTHHDLRKAFGLVGVLVLSEVLTHIPVALVQLLKLGDVGQSSDICRNVYVTVKGWRRAGKADSMTRVCCYLGWGSWWLSCRHTPHYWSLADGTCGTDRSTSPSLPSHLHWSYRMRHKHWSVLLLTAAALQRRHFRRTGPVEPEPSLARLLSARRVPATKQHCGEATWFNHDSFTLMISVAGTHDKLPPCTTVWR